MLNLMILQRIRIQTSSKFCIAFTLRRTNNPTNQILKTTAQFQIREETQIISKLEEIWWNPQDLWNTVMKTCWSNVATSCRTVRAQRHFSVRAQSTKETIWRVDSKREGPRNTNDKSAASARFYCLSRTVRALMRSDGLHCWSDCPVPDAADGPRSMGGRSAAWYSFFQLLSTFWFWISNPNWCLYMDISTNPRVSMHAYTYYVIE